MSDITKRISAWEAKTDPERVKLTLDKIHTKMTERYRAAMGALCAMEEQVRTVLNTQNVHTIHYVPYLNYGRQMHKMSKQEISGNSAQLAAQVLLEKWAARGLDPNVLAAIRTEVFNIVAPTP
ncbi:MAG: hypothetical protein R6W83_01840 [Cryobacterium sp.]